MYREGGNKNCKIQGMWRSTEDSSKEQWKRMEDILKKMWEKLKGNIDIEMADLVGKREIDVLSPRQHNWNKKIRKITFEYYIRCKCI